MKTTANRDLFAYWNTRRGHRLAPERGDIEPDAIRHVLGDSFFLTVSTAAEYPFRLAGTRLCALFGRELKNDSFISLWTQADQNAMRKLVATVVDEKVGVVAQATGRTDRTPTSSPLLVNLELLMLPLLQRGPLDARVLGAIVPVDVPFWLGARFVGTLELGALRHVGPTVDQVPAPRLMPAAPSVIALNPVGKGTASQDTAKTNAPALRVLSAPQIRSNRRRFVVYEGGRSE